MPLERAERNERQASVTSFVSRKKSVGDGDAEKAPEDSPERGTSDKDGVTTGWTLEALRTEIEDDMVTAESDSAYDRE